VLAANPQPPKPRRRLPLPRKPLRNPLYSGFLSGTTDKAEKKLLAAGVKRILEHFGVDRVTEITEADRAKAMEFGTQLVEAFAESGADGIADVTFEFEGGDEGDDDGDGDDVL